MREESDVAELRAVADLDAGAAKTRRRFVHIRRRHPDLPARIHLQDWIGTEFRPYVVIVEARCSRMFCYKKANDD